MRRRFLEKCIFAGFCFLLWAAPLAGAAENQRKTWGLSAGPRGQVIQSLPELVLPGSKPECIHKTWADLFEAHDGLNVLVVGLVSVVSLAIFLLVMFFYKNRLVREALRLKIKEGAAYQERILNSERVMRGILNTIPHVVLGLDRRRFTFANEGAKAVLGWDPKELIGQSTRILYPDDASFERFGILAYQEIRHKGYYSGQVEFLKKNGERITCRVDLKSIEDKTDTKTVAVIQDISEVIRAEQAVHEQKNLLENIINTIPNFVFWKDRQIRYLGCNEKLAEVSGYASPEEMIGKTDYDMPWTREEADFFRKIDEEVMSTGQPILDIEEPQHQADGSVKTLLTSKVPLRDKHKNVIGLLGVFTDITVRKTREEEFRKLSQAVEQSPVTIVITDLEGNIQYANPAFTRATGYDLKDVIGKNPRVLKSGYTSSEEYKQLWDAISAGGQWRGEFHNKKKSGELFWERATITPIKDESGKITHYLGIKENITERKEMSQRLEEANAELTENAESLAKALINLENSHQKLKDMQNQLVQREKLAAIGELSAGVAHEINNPVGFISNNFEVLQEYIQDFKEMIQKVESLKAEVLADSSARARAVVAELSDWQDKVNLEFIMDDIDNLLTQTQSGIERIKKIVLDLRTFARAEMDRMEMLKVEDVIESILNIVNNEIKYKVDLVKKYGDTPMIKASSSRLGQVFINLLMNAAQAIVDHGVIEIRTSTDPQFLYVDIQDSGGGIPPEMIKKIFDPFFTTKPVGQGTGLGLSVSYEIIKQHEGELLVYSVPGKGTTFTVKLPLTVTQGTDDGQTG